MTGQLSRIKHGYRFVWSNHFVLIITIVYFLIICMIFPYTISLRNLSNLSSNMWPLLALVIGQMFVMLVAGIDLSQTSIMAVASVAGAMVMADGFDAEKFSNNPLWGIAIFENGGLLSGSSFAVPVAICIMLLVGTFIGFINGISVAKFKIPSFMVTLVSMSFFSGLAIYMTHSENIRYLPESFIAIGKGSLGVLSYSMFLTLFLALLAWIILNRLIIGRWIYAVGMNIKVSAVSGVPCSKVIVFAYMFSGFCAAAGSILYTARLEAGRPTLGENLLLDIIGSAVIGGISLFGGKGKLTSAVYGVLFFVVLNNSLNKMPLNFYLIDIIKGLIILIAALLDVFSNRLNQISMKVQEA